MEASVCSCNDWGDPPEFYHATIRKARKTHHCCECGAEIAPGERYQHVSRMWDGFIDTFKTCLLCSRIRRDYCAPLGGLREVLWDLLEVDYLGEWEWKE